MSYEVIEGDCIEELAKLEENSIDAIVTDPPYGLKFMGKDWDDAGDGAQQQEWHRLWAVEAYRVLKPGGHLLAFGGSRTYHRLASAVEDAGFEIRDQIMWLYGSGFPKSLNVGKAIDKQRDDADRRALARHLRDLLEASGKSRSEIDRHFHTSNVSQYWFSDTAKAEVPPVDKWPWLREWLKASPELDQVVWNLNGRKGQPGENWFKREVVGKGKSAIANKDEGPRHTVGASKAVEFDLTAPATEQAAQWEGWGTALKPAHEPIVVARKPLIGTVAANVLEHGTGAINIDGCRVGNFKNTTPSGIDRYNQNYVKDGANRKTIEAKVGSQSDGRWPANIILDEEAGALLDEQTTGRVGSGHWPETKSNGQGPFVPGGKSTYLAGGHKDTDKGGASRFFYQAKASKKERNAGLDLFADKQAGCMVGNQGVSSSRTAGDGTTPVKPVKAKNNHPTVKPIELMRYLCRLVTPPGGTVLDPFLGSGTTGCAVAVENNEKGTDWNFIGIEREADYLPIARARIDYWANQEPN